MAVDADGRPADVRHLLSNCPNQRAVLLRHGIARGIRNIDDRGSGLDGRLDHFEKIGRIGAAGVFRVELHVLHKLPGELDRRDRHFAES